MVGLSKTAAQNQRKTCAVQTPAAALAHTRQLPASARSLLTCALFNTAKHPDPIMGWDRGTK